MKKKCISLLMVIAMLMAMIPVTAVQAATVDSWTVYFSKVTEGKDAVVRIDTSEAASGESSLFASFELGKKSMYYVSVSQ